MRREPGLDSLAVRSNRARAACPACDSPHNRAHSRATASPRPLSRREGRELDGGWAIRERVRGGCVRRCERWRSEQGSDENQGEKALAGEVHDGLRLSIRLGFSVLRREHRATA